MIVTVNLDAPIPMSVQEVAAPCVIIGETKEGRRLVFSPQGSFPDSIGALIQTDKGVRKLLSIELAKANLEDNFLAGAQKDGGTMTGN